MPLGVKASNQIDIKTHQKTRERRDQNLEGNTPHIRGIGRERIESPIKRLHSIVFPSKSNGLSTEQKLYPSPTLLLYFFNDF